MSAEENESFRLYAVDGAEALQDIEESLLSLEAKPDDIEGLNRLYRSMHTLKGNSALLGLTNIEAVAHAAEDMVGMVRDRGVALERELVQLLLEFKDEVARFVERAGTDRCDAGPDDMQGLLLRFRAWIERQGGLKREAQSARRGDLLIWSSLPPAGRTPEQFTVELAGPEGALGLERLLRPASVALQTMSAQVGDLTVPAVAAELASAFIDLAAAADECNELETAAAFSRVAAQLNTPPYVPASFLAEFSALQLLLTELDTRYRSQASFPEDFGVVALMLELAVKLRREQLLPRSSQHHEAHVAVKGDQPGAEKRKLQAGSDGAGSAESKPDYLRIDAHKVSLIMELTGELALACGAVTHHPELVGLMPEGFVTASQKLELLVRELQSEVSAMRLVPVSGVFQRMRRVVRDTSQRTGKNVELELRGEETEIDKVMVDALHDPLVHLVRNAIDHGIETPSERVAAGKPESGLLILEATHRGGEVSVTLRDDGRGMSRQRIRARAEERGLLAKDAQIADADLLELVFLPGFSTKESIDELSGRGVGMDVIRTTVQRLRGRVQLRSEEGRGSSVDMTVPLTLAFVEAMVVCERDQLFAIPIEKVIEVFKPELGQLHHNSAGGATSLRVRDRLIPITWLHRYFGETRQVDERLEGRVIVVVQTARGMVAIPVHSLLGNQPVMLKPLRGVLSGVRSAAGCGMLRNGAVALALDCERLHD